MSLIEVSLCRVSADGKYIDMIFSPPAGSKIQFIQIEAHYLDGNSFVKKKFNIELEDNKNILKIPIKNLDLEGIPAIYCIVLYAYDITTNELVTTSTVYISDVNNVYLSILDDILSMGEKCSELSEQAVKKYLILYGHLASLYQGHIDEAKMLFKILIKNFSKCGVSKRNNNCGTSYNTSYVKSDCGCKK